MSCSPPLPRSPRSPAHNSAAASPPPGPSSITLPCPLNPDAAPFSPSRASEVMAEEMPEWLLFSQSSLEGWSSVGRRSIASPAPSFVDVVRSKGKAPMVKPPLPPRTPALMGGFMADARRSNAGRRVSPPPATGQQQHIQEEDGWRLVSSRKQGRCLVAPPPPPPLQPHRSVLTDLIGLCFNYLRSDHIAADCRNAVHFL
jgi:hypothetical protein